MENRAIRRFRGLYLGRPRYFVFAVVITLAVVVFLALALVLFLRLVYPLD